MKVSFWSFEITDDKKTNRAMNDSQNLHVIANLQIWICIEFLMLVKSVSDYISGIGGVNATFLATRVFALLYWIFGFIILKRFPKLVTKALVIYHILLSVSMIVFSRELCGVHNGGIIAYELITRFYLLVYVVIMVLLNSNYVFT